MSLYFDKLRQSDRELLIAAVVDTFMAWAKAEPEDQSLAAVKTDKARKAFASDNYQNNCVLTLIDQGSFFLLRAPVNGVLAFGEGGVVAADGDETKLQLGGGDATLETLMPIVGGLLAYRVGSG